MTRRLILFAAVIALTPALAVAQTTLPATPALQDAPSSTIVMPARRAMSAAARIAQLELRIKDLHNRLQITPAQEPQWTAFTTVMRANAARMGEMYQSGNPQTMTAMDTLRHYAKIAQAHSEEITNLVAPFKALYDSMTPAQQKIADEAFHSFGRREQMRG